MIGLPCETHATVLLSFSPLPSLFLHPPPRTYLSTPPPSTRPPHTENDQPSLVWFDRGKFYLTFEGKFALHQACVHAHFRGSFVQASLPLHCPLSPFPLPLFPPPIILTLAMLTPGWDPRKRKRKKKKRQSKPSGLLLTTFMIVHSHFVCVDHLSFISWRTLVLRVLISLTSRLPLFGRLVLGLTFLDCLIFYGCVETTQLQQHVWDKHAILSESFLTLSGLHFLNLPCFFRKLRHYMLH